MKYKIILVKIEEDIKTSREWVEVDPYKNDDGEEKHFDYRDIQKEVEVEQEIYSQTIETEDLDIKSIINSFNN